MPEFRTLKDYILTYLRTAPMIPRPAHEAWGDLIHRICVPSQIAEVDEETYDYFLEVLPPKYQGAGFAFAEGAEPLTYFWTKDGHFFCRQLTRSETVTFCCLARIPLPS